MNNRQYDVVLYGASGFVGKQTAEYFAQKVDQSTVKWAIAAIDLLLWLAIFSVI